MFKTNYKNSEHTTVSVRQRLLMQCLFVVLLLVGVVPFFATQVVGVRMSPASNHTRIVLDLSSPTQHHLMTLDAPERLVIDLQNTDIPSGLKLPAGSGVVARLRSGKQSDGRLRLVADLKSFIKVKSFLIPADGRKKDRLVIDLYHQSMDGDVVAPIKSNPKGSRDLIIAIDAGHGGIDPGSIGKHGTQEKRVVMQIARRLANKINKAEGMSAFLVRDSDKKIQYHERMERARKKDADLFVSIHADSFSDASVGGSSVYVLSQRGASSTAASWLANKLNSDDLVGGVSLNDKDDMLASVLLDLSQNASIAASTTLGKSVLNELAAIGRVRKQSVQYANFAVLKSPDVPSILVETAYISNPAEEKKLNNPKHQERIATALYKGVKQYFRNNPPPDSLFAQQREQRSTPSARKPVVVAAATAPKPATNLSAKPRVQASGQISGTAVIAQKEYPVINHKIKPGETLSAVSKRYNITLKTIKSINNLTKDTVRIGQVLRIPVI